jgi:dephospho-CoA kinase
MLRIGLTGGLGSGKSTVAAMLRELGAYVIEADELGRALMEPRQPVYSSIVEHFGRQVVNTDGQLNRARLAELAFREGRLEELNAIVHPPVIEAQHKWMNEVFARDPEAVAVIESALIFEVVRDAGVRGEKESALADWRRRIDRVIVVTAPDALKVARYAARVMSSGSGGSSVSGSSAGSRSGSTSANREAEAPSDRSSSLGREAIEADARNRLAHQVPDAEKAAQADYVLDNSGEIAALRAQVESLWPRLREESNASRAQRNNRLQKLSLK